MVQEPSDLETLSNIVIMESTNDDMEVATSTMCEDGQMRIVEVAHVSVGAHGSPQIISSEEVMTEVTAEETAEEMTEVAEEEATELTPEEAVKLTEPQAVEDDVDN